MKTAKVILWGEGLEEIVHSDFVRRAAEVICGEVRGGALERTAFESAEVETNAEGPAWEQSLRRFEALMVVAREAHQLEGRSPGVVLKGLWLVVEALEQEESRRPPGKRKKVENLLDGLQVRGMERRIARRARGIMGANLAIAQLLLDGHGDLLRVAVRHRMIAEPDAAKAEAQIEFLRGKLRED